MAHESFEDGETAELINRYFVPVKVDREERPDIDSVYMAACQAFTGGGGWPMSVFLTPEGRPFFAGTYFPKVSRGGSVGLRELLSAIHTKWEKDRDALLSSADEVTAMLASEAEGGGEADDGLIDAAVGQYKVSFDKKYGGFGAAPKFPAAHNLLFLMVHYEKTGDRECLSMAETTLTQMYRGGIFDHIGGGFSRYSTDKYFLAPHFEKMLYDNALLIMAYTRAFDLTKNRLYLTVAERTAGYILRELSAPEGGFMSAQDADSEGEEGRYYLFTPEEVIGVLGMRGADFNRRFDITKAGNFEGKSIPNLLKSEDLTSVAPGVEALYDYRRGRAALHLDDKRLTAWNALTVAALCGLYKSSLKEEYLQAARGAASFIDAYLTEGDTLFVSYRDGRRGSPGFLDDYAAWCFALLTLYDATLESAYLESAKRFCAKAVADFRDEKNGGFYMTGGENETLIARPKETYDGAMPSGNSLMAWVLTRLYLITGAEAYREAAKRQLDFMSTAAARYPAGHAMFLLALSDYLTPPTKITVVPAPGEDMAALALSLPRSAVTATAPEGGEYRLKDGRTTYYVCRGNTCLPPVNEM